MTKKEIRTALSPMSSALRSGAKAQTTQLLGLQIECDRLHNARGCTGFSWNPHFAAYRNGKIVTGGNLTEIVDRLAIIQHNS